MAVELALIAPVLLLILAGLIDTSRLVVQSMQVRAAAQAGADYAQTQGFDAAKIQKAVKDATPLAVTAPTPTAMQACVANRTIVAAAAGACASGGLAGQFVTVQAQAAFAPLMPWPAVVLPSTLSAKAVVRIS